MKIICRGAESVIYFSDHEGEQVLVKERIKKGYRIQELDKTIRKRRTKSEERLLTRTRRTGVETPKVYGLTENKILMEFVSGTRVKELLAKSNARGREAVYEKIGMAVARMHSDNIIHGDLTTSNMIMKNDRLYLIDFGLGFNSSRVEDKAIDLFLLYEALKSTHFELLEGAWKNILKVYKQKYTNALEVLTRLDKIKKRRRYK